MARVAFVTTLLPLAHLYTVDQAVGALGVNDRKDVLLVQFFLATVFPMPTLPYGAISPIDGNCGQQTINQIRFFQGIVGSGGLLNRKQFSPGNIGSTSTRMPSTQDGTSNTIVFGEQQPSTGDPNFGTVAAPSNGNYLASMTIVQLNRSYCDAFGPERFRRIDLDPLFPQELFEAFFGRVLGRVRETASRQGSSSSLGF
jgi:hypothetical protein